MEKTCKTCTIIKDISCFAINKQCKGGYANHCKDCINKKQKQVWDTNKEEISIKRSKRRRNKIEQYRESERLRRKNYRENNKEEVNRKYREYMKNYRAKNPSFCISKRIANTIKLAIEYKKSSHDIFSKLNYSIEDLMYYLASLFKDGMSWDNYGEWHIDHIIPQSWLPFTSLEDDNFIKCWSLSNLQPMWAKENISKSNRYSGTPDNPTAFLCDLDFHKM